MLLGIALGCSGGHHGKTPTGAAGLQETPGFADLIIKQLAARNLIAGTAR